MLNLQSLCKRDESVAFRLNQEQATGAPSSATEASVPPAISELQAKLASVREELRAYQRREVEDQQEAFRQ